MATMILTREQRNLFNLHWKSLIAASHARPVTAEIFVELILMRYPVDNIREALFKAFAPSMPSAIRGYINKGSIDSTKLDYMIRNSYGRENYITLFKSLHQLRNHYFGMFHFKEASLPKGCNKLHISSKVWLETEQLALILKVIDGELAFLRTRIFDLESPTDSNQQMNLHNFGVRGKAKDYADYESWFCHLAAEGHAAMKSMPE
jgi:hypothetical protein